MVGCGIQPHAKKTEGNAAMTATEMEDVLKNLDRRTSRMEQILPTLATKEDLKEFATNEDLKGFATKEDLKRFATKEDLQRFATKEDLQRFATKEDLKAFATKEDLKAFATKEDLNGVKVLVEDLRDSVAMVAAHVADISERLPPRA
jgi:glutaredoxin 2